MGQQFRSNENNLFPDHFRRHPGHVHFRSDACVAAPSDPKRHKMDSWNRLHTSIFIASSRLVSGTLALPRHRQDSDLFRLFLPSYCHLYDILVPIDRLDPIGKQLVPFCTGRHAGISSMGSSHQHGYHLFGHGYHASIIL